MVEIRNLSFNDLITYEGLMDVKGFYTMLNKWLDEHKYDRLEEESYEFVTEDGKQINLVMRPYRKISEYSKTEIKLEIDFSKLKEVVVEIKGRRKKVYKGSVNIAFHTFLVTDRERSWENPPIIFFLRTLLERFIYRSYIEKYEEDVVEHKNILMREVKSYFNMHKFEE